MKRMKKGAFALLLTLCVTLGLLPALTVTANAAGYSVTVGSTTNGSVTADKTSASQGETVTLTVTPNGGFVLDALTIDGGSVTPVLKSSPTSFYGSSEWTFTMPDKNVTVSATFKIGIPRGITKDITGQGTVTVSAYGTENSTQAVSDAVVTLTVTPNEGFELTSLTVEGESTTTAYELTDIEGGKQFVMPDENVTVRAVFQETQTIYTVTAADTTTTAGKKYQYGDAFTIAVTVSGGAFEGGEFTLTYDNTMFQLKTESVAPGKNDNDAKNTKTNQTGENSNGQYDFSLNNGVSFTDGNSLVNLTFKVIGNVSAKTDYTFAFKDGKASVCYGLNKDTVAATTVTGATVTVEPSSLTVTLNGQNGVTFVNASNTAITSDTATYGAAYTVKIGDYDALRYAYPVTLKVGGTEVTDAPSPATDGTITIPAASVTGAIELTVSRAAKFTVTITPNYVTGYSLITVAKTNAEDTTVYAYGDTAMYYVNAYSAYACIIAGTVEQSAEEAAVKVGTASAGTIANGEPDTTKYDVNGTGKTDYSDALLTYRCYVVKYETPTTAMETYLRADVNGDKKADTTDVSAVDGNRTQETT